MELLGAMRRFVIIGQHASASPAFLLDDLPGSSGRLDVLVRCLRAAFLVSHGLRHDVITYLVLLGGAGAPRVVRIDGREAKFLRPDERALATLVQKALGRDVDRTAPGFVALRHGVALAEGGLDVVLPELAAGPLFVLEEGAPDLREAADVDAAEVSFVLGDHLGFDAATRATLAAAGARPLGVGPLSLHTEDVITLLLNELDRRAARPS